MLADYLIIDANANTNFDADADSDAIWYTLLCCHADAHAHPPR